MTWDEMEAAVAKAENLGHRFVMLTIWKPGYKFRGGGNIRTGLPGVGLVRVINEVGKDRFLIEVPVEKLKRSVNLWRHGHER